MACKSIMIVGVGGQGTLLASRLLGRVFTDMGYDTKVSEVHGMSQRGGSVVTYVKYGDKVYSPVIDEGEADLIISFEELEAARWLPFLKPSGTIITSTQKIDPMPVITGSAQYPEEIVETLKENGISIIALDALSLAEQAGSAKAVNLVLLGVAARQLDIDKALWITAIQATVPQKFLDMNLKAFKLGFHHSL